MYGSRLVSALAAVFTAIAVLFAIFGVVANVGFFAVALLFGAVAYFMWYHASGRFAQRLYRGVEERAAPGGGGRGGRGGFGAGPREDWEPPRDEDAGRRARAAGGQARGGRARTGGRRRQARAGGQRRRRRAAAAAQPSGPTAAEAYDTLELDRGADDDAVKAAYREKVKEVHPDSPDGDEEEFKEVQSAYERLTD
ncbi:heat shock protein DnaJ domain-containing protein [Halosimplex carlsbadense 2-9-1]|uniref:Heat shock protein DnaJ domain-containing protein n=1 Tax=Halosimplex carlsbadense 2-9-1 TaxID=797114 RepID=M0CKK9_9EURY|nr:J domain-containing protein [Halosimplex carlsbadense]ELZ23158.1 heat shock protein DnaJ domain-containing protein [Halosimplex carlsbadense 2-9-1]